MKIAVFSGFNPALNPYILLFKRTLERQGLSVDLERTFSLPWLLKNSRNYDCFHLHWVNFPIRISEDKIHSRFLRALLMNRPVKVALEAIGLFQFAFALLLARLMGKRTVFTVHDLDHVGEHFYSESWRGILFNRIANYVAFWFCHAIHVHNHYTRKLIETRYYKRYNVFVVPHGNYIGCYPNTISKTQARRHLGLPEHVFVYLFIGLVRPYKGIENLIESFQRLYGDVTLIVAGQLFDDTGYGLTLLSLAYNDTRIKLIFQFIPDESLQIYLNACDIFVLPYKGITTSGAAALSHSFGRPVIAPNLGSFPEIINSATGVLYDPTKPDALISALQTAMNRSWDTYQILEYADNFHWDKLGSKLSALYI